jgi:hypothetical protein
MRMAAPPRGYRFRPLRRCDAFILRSPDGRDVQPTFVPIRYSRVFPHGLAETFDWLTDYREDDPSLTTAVVVDKRPVVKREGDTVTLHGTLEILGNRGSGIVEVKLQPPDRYTATIVQGAGKGSVYEYALTPVSPTATRLDVTYNVRVKRLRKRILVAIARPLVRRDIARMWEGYAAAMAKDLSGAQKSVAPAA